MPSSVTFSAFQFPMRSQEEPSHSFNYFLETSTVNYQFSQINISFIGCKFCLLQNTKRQTQFGEILCFSTGVTFHPDSSCLFPVSIWHLTRITTAFLIFTILPVATNAFSTMMVGFSLTFIFFSLLHTKVILDVTSSIQVSFPPSTHYPVPKPIPHLQVICYSSSLGTNMRRDDLTKTPSRWLRQQKCLSHDSDTYGVGDLPPASAVTRTYFLACRQPFCHLAVILRGGTIEKNKWRKTPSITCETTIYQSSILVTLCNTVDL